MKTCKTCKWWKDGTCDIVDSVGTAGQEPATLFEIFADASDDTGLYTALRTGPDFGCILHEEEDKK